MMVVQTLIRQLITLHIFFNLTMCPVWVALLIAWVWGVMISREHLCKRIPHIHSSVHGSWLVQICVVVASHTRMAKLWRLHIMSAITHGIALEVFWNHFLFEHIRLEYLHRIRGNVLYSTTRVHWSIEFSVILISFRM